jgi:hypothetical protein
MQELSGVSEAAPELAMSRVRLIQPHLETNSASNDAGCAQSYCGLLTAKGNFHRDNLLCSAESRGQQRYQTDWPCAHDRDIVIGSNVARCDGAHGY